MRYDLGFPVVDFLQKLRERTEGYCVPVLIVALVFIGPVMCKVVARMTRAFRPWFMKSASVLVACLSMISANIALFQWLGDEFAWCVWAQDVFFVLFMFNWVFTPVLHLRAGSADALDDKIEQRRSDGWNSLVFRWIPSTGVHRVMLAKRVTRKTSAVVLPSGAQPQ